MPWFAFFHLFFGFETNSFFILLFLKVWLCVLCFNVFIFLLFYFFLFQNAEFMQIYIKIIGKKKKSTKIFHHLCHLCVCDKWKLNRFFFHWHKHIRNVVDLTYWYKLLTIDIQIIIMMIIINSYVIQAW